MADDRAVGLEHIAAFELLTGEPWPAEPTTAHRIRARAAKAMLQASEDESRIKAKQERKLRRR